MGTIFDDINQPAPWVRSVLDDLVYCIQKQRFWCISRRILVSQQALNVIYASHLADHGVKGTVARWVRQQRSLRIVRDLGSFPDRPHQLIVGDQVNVLWRKA